MCEMVSVNASMSEKVCICQQVNVNACECLCWGNTSRIQDARKTQLIPESAPFNGRDRWSNCSVKTSIVHGNKFMKVA